MIDRSKAGLSVVELALGLEVYLKVPVASRLGLAPLVESGDLTFAVEAADVTTDKIWRASGSYEIQEVTGNLVLQVWDVEATEKTADEEDVNQTVIALSDFLMEHHRVERRIFLQALEWDE